MTETHGGPHSRPDTAGLSQERSDLIATLATHRFFLRKTVQGLTDEQARLRPTVSRLCLGGLVKHVTHAEQQWTNFIQGRAGGPSGERSDSIEQHEQSFGMLPGETLTGLLGEYEQVAAATAELIATLPDLDASRPLPPAPWFEPGARWSARRALLHILAETAQHAGHADIIRETIDGARTMG
jgi:uncharacterized damage-inducible protein DinB